MIYTDLVTQVQDYLETREAKFVANIPTFVRAVENYIYNEVQLPALRRNVTGSTQVGEIYLSAPQDFLSVFSLALVDPDNGQYNYLLSKDVNLIREMYPDPNVVDTPRVYGTFDPKTLIIGPSPNKAYKVELHYFFYPQSLVDAGTSWVATNFPMVMLYGVIAEGYRFLKGDVQQQQIYDDRYEKALNLLRKLGEGRSRNDAYRDTATTPKANVGE